MPCMLTWTLFYLQERERFERVQKESLSREWDRAVERSSGASGAIPKGQMYIKKKWDDHCWLIARCEGWWKYIYLIWDTVWYLKFPIKSYILYPFVKIPYLINDYFTHHHMSPIRWEEFMNIFEISSNQKIYCESLALALSWSICSAVSGFQ